MTRPVNTEAHEALRVAECLRIALARNEFMPAERENLTGLYAANVAEAVPALFPGASAELLAKYAPYVCKVLEVMLDK